MNITLPDGSIRELAQGSTGLDLANDIGPGLAKAAVAVVVNGSQMDLCDPIETDSEVSIITINSDDGLEIMRHTLTAQVLARAIKNLYPTAKLAIGPTIEDGFYYDFATETAISSDDLPKIENEMRNIIASGDLINKSLNTKKDAIKAFKSKKEEYKIAIINESEQADDFQIYQQGDSDFIDLCRGPHLPSLEHIGAFKLTKVAGAYWRGKSENEMLTRIYGTAWNNDKDLAAYLNRMEEAEKRDHRKLGKEMDLFHFQDEAPGMVFWHPNGWTIYRELQNFVRKRLVDNGYVEINTPQVIDRKLWEASGHWDKYRENMFITEIDEEHANEKRINALKPMNCPGHVQIYNQGIKSYRDLPLKFAEFGSCHRYEPSGTMHGLMRVRAFTQDDGHIFCTEDQIESETGLFIKFLSSVYADLGFKSFDIKLSTRPEMRVGSDEIWDKAELALETAIKNLGYPYKIDEGDGAFYGPKLDFNLAERLDAEYVGEDGKKHIPVMIHRAILGSFERFIGILIENYAGKLPLWLAPRQVVIASITTDVNPYVNEVASLLKELNVRVETDTRNEKISYKVREHSASKVPVIMVIGKKEMEERTISIRRLGSSENTSYSLNDIVEQIAQESKDSSNTQEL